MAIVRCRCHPLQRESLQPNRFGGQGANGGAFVHGACRRPRALEVRPLTRAESNHRLALLMREAALSNKALARAVRAASMRRGEPVSCDHTSVSRWLNGMQPRGQTARSIADALSAKLGRTLTLADIGLSNVEDLDPNVGTVYPDEPGHAINVLTGLWRADLDEVRAIASAPTNANAWAEATLSWLVRPGNDHFTPRSGGIRVGSSDVATVRATTEAFALLDNRFGGGHARRALVQYLQSDLSALLAGSYSEETGRHLYSATAEATLLAAWMSYDAGAQGLAQRYFIQALRLAQAADDELLAGSILGAMSHQATFLGRSREAANLARAARTGTKRRATPTLTAHFHAMEARALAAAGDAVGSHHALSGAVKVFERRHPEDDPEWISYFDDAELNAEFSHCFRDIGRSSDAVAYAQRALSGASARSDFFVTMVLASGYLGLGTAEIEEACRLARTALDLGAQLKSARCAAYLRQFRERLAPFGSTMAVQELNECAAESALWLASEHPI
jgi:tetratricopeptide (TPR) repeat protein